MSTETVELQCGCIYFKDSGRAPMHACENHRWITCARCHGQAEVTFLGVWCQRCSPEKKETAL